MKTYFLIFATLFSSFAFLSCSNDDDNQPIEPDNHPIVGKWDLISITGGWDPRHFNSGDYIYNFSSDGTMEITVAEGVEQSDDYTIYGLNFTYTINDSILVLTSDNYPDHPLDTPFLIENDTLKFITDLSAGGNIDTFVRLE